MSFTNGSAVWPKARIKLQYRRRLELRLRGGDTVSVRYYTKGKGTTGRDKVEITGEVKPGVKLRSRC